MALIYCERLVKETQGRLCIRYDNWKPMYVLNLLDYLQWYLCYNCLFILDYLHAW